MFFGSLAAGGAAGGTALFVGYPLDMARTRLATDVTMKSGVRTVTSTWGCIKGVYMLDGVTGVYRGFGIALFGVVVFKGLFMGGYDIAKAVLNLDGSKNNGKESKRDAATNLGKRFFVAQVHE
jgi:solute carrier family 25 (adenine nucleotide translocator) protein 4/5/6/31